MAEQDTMDPMQNVTVPQDFSQPIQIKPLTPLYDPTVAVDALHNVVDTQKEAIKSSAEALEKNTVLQQNLLDTQTKLQDDSLQAYDNLTKIARWGDVADVLSLFNPKWSKTEQELRIKKNDIKTQQQSLRTQAQININNALPALKETTAKLAEQDFENQLKTFNILSTVKGLEQKDVELQTKMIEQQINLSQEQRNRIKLGVDALSIDQAKSELVRARKGQGPFAGLDGILENKINTDEKSQIELKNLKLANATNNIELQTKTEERIAHLIPVDEAQALAADAMQKGQPFITWRGAQVPTATVMEAADKNQKTSDALQLSILNGRLEKVNTEYNETSSMLQSMALVDPRANNEFQLLSRGYAQLDPNNPASVANFGLLVTASKKRAADITKTVAATYSTPEAKAAITQFGETGKPSVVGSQAVVQDVMGNYGRGTQAKFSDAWGYLSKELAKRVAAQNPAGSPFVDQKDPKSLQTMNMLAWLSTHENKKLPQLKEEILADPLVGAEVTRRIAGTLSADTANRALQTLAKAPTGDPVWKTLLANEQLYTTGNAFDRRKLINYLEEKSIVTGPGGIDYNKLFSDALKAEVMNANSTSNTDAKKTIDDHFLETYYYGDNPAQSAVQDFIVNYEQDRAKAHDEMLQRVNRDVTGATQTEAASQQMSLYGRAKVGLPPPEAIMNNVKTTPSATGVTGVTADQMRVLYGGGVR